MAELIFVGVLAFIVLPVVTEAITDIIAVATIFDKPRNWISNKSKFMKELLGCKYCLSVWAAAFVCLSIFAMYEPDWRSILCYAILVVFVHRLSNIFHFLFDIILEYRTYRWAITIRGDEK